MTVYAYDCRLVNERLYRAFLDRVSPERRAKAKNFYRREDAVRTVVGEAMVRHLFGALYPARAFALSKNAYGKPYVQGFPDFHFNVSHSGDFVVCAVADGEVGVDVEHIRQADMALAERFFSRPEVEHLRGIPAGEQARWFYMIWTAKESYIKCVGEGLSIPLDSFWVLDGRVVRDGVPTRFCVNHLFLDNRHPLAVCQDGEASGGLVLLAQDFGI